MKILHLFLMSFSVVGCSGDSVEKSEQDKSVSGETYRYSILRNEDARGAFITSKMIHRRDLSDYLMFLPSKEKRWVRCADNLGRPLNRIKSPVMPYGDLKYLLDFSDSNVVSLPDSNPSCDGLVKADLLSLEVYFADARDHSIAGAKFDDTDDCYAILVEHKYQQFIDRYSENRKYRYPSIMCECDYHSDGGLKQSLYSAILGSSSTGGGKWFLFTSPIGRQWKYLSPIMTYGELQETIHFDDDDLVFEKDPQANSHQAVIETAWLTCHIWFEGMVYDGKDRDVLLKAMITDKRADEEVKGDERRYHFSPAMERRLRPRDVSPPEHWKHLLPD